MTYHHPLNQWLLLILPAIGGLVSGIIVYTFAPEAEGHGTEKVIEAVHRHDGYIKPIVVPIKLVTTVITLACGGSAGKEGPVSQIGAGLAGLNAALLLEQQGVDVLLLEQLAVVLAQLDRVLLAGLLQRLLPAVGDRHQLSAVLTVEQPRVMLAEMAVADDSDANGIQLRYLPVRGLMGSR